MNRSEKLNALFLQIQKKRGRLTPAIVVKEAENRKHPLHREFDWNNASAAHKHRLEQAAELIRFVRIKIVLPSGPAIVRQWHAVKAAGAAGAMEGYLSNQEVVATPMFRAAMLQQMERDWKALTARYDHLKEFWAMVSKAKSRRRKSA